ncbi:MAG: alpha/beta hydrolase-fold protein [Blautia sp.]|nr:alpha/beta hydrolase-fold protein [Blautia sp.]
MQKGWFLLKAALLAGTLVMPYNVAAEAQEETVQVEYTAADYEVPFFYDLESVTELEGECDQKGTVVSLEYETPAYAVNEILDTNQTMSKSVSVYLPYGYDETKQYNVLYLLHGTGGNDEYWLVNEKTGVPTCNVLDNMIAQGLCEPLIVVAPNYYSEIKDKEYKLSDEIVAEYAEEVQDPLLVTRNDLWPEFFKEELRNQIIPLIESEYATYANGDVSEENLAATREHRALAGLSRGSMASVRSGLMANTDYIAYFGSYSGVWADFDKFKEILTEGVFNSGRKSTKRL